MTNLKGMTWDHPRGYDPMVATSAAFAKKHPGVSITWEKRSLQAFADAGMEELAREFDLIVIDHPHVGLVSRAGCLEPLDLAGFDEEMAFLAQETLGPSHPSYHYDGHQWALAIDAATQVACFRPDLISQPPATWNEVIELAKQKWVLWPIKPIDSLMSFMTLAANRGTPCATDGSKQLIAPDDARAVFEALYEVAKYIPAECLSYNPIDCYERLVETDQYVYCPLGYGYTNYSRESFRRKQLRFTDIPMLHEDYGPRGSTIGGTGIAVSAYSKNKEIAIDYAFWIASAEVQRTIYFDSGGQPANALAWDDATCNQKSLGFFNNTRKTLDNVYLRPRYDGYLDFQDEGGNVVNACLSGKIGISQAISDLDAAYLRSLK